MRLVAATCAVDSHLRPPIALPRSGWHRYLVGLPCSPTMRRMAHFPCSTWIAAKNPSVCSLPCFGKKPSALQRKPATVRKRSADAEKAVTVPEVELEPKQDTAVVDDSQLLPDQPKKRCRYTGVASDAGHPPTKDKYHIMKYLRYGKDGTCAIRLKGGSQFTEINMPKATLLQNQEVAEAICGELNKGVKPDTVRELMSMLKETMCKNISKG